MGVRRLTPWDLNDLRRKNSGVPLEVYRQGDLRTESPAPEADSPPAEEAHQSSSAESEDDDPPDVVAAWGALEHSKSWPDMSKTTPVAARFRADLRISNAAAIERARAEWEAKLRLITEKQFQVASRTFVDALAEGSGVRMAFRVALSALGIRVEGGRVMTDHTPGPWYSEDVIFHSPEEHGVAVIARYADVPIGGTPTRGMIAWVHQSATTSDDEVEANAHLIMAAPDLLAACDMALVALKFLQEIHPQSFAGAIGGERGCRDAIKKIDAAIALAMVGRR